MQIGPVFEDFIPRASLNNDQYGIQCRSRKHATGNLHPANPMGRVKASLGDGFLGRIAIAAWSEVQSTEKTGSAGMSAEVT